MSLPTWITPVKGFKARFILDPDKFYPALLEELVGLYDPSIDGEGSYADVETDTHSAAFYKLFPGTIDRDNPDQYWLEVCHQMVKLDSLVALKAAKIHRVDVSTVYIIRGAEGHQERWGQKNHPAGSRYEAIRKFYASVKMADRRVAIEARQHYQHLRGFIPVG